MKANCLNFIITSFILLLRFDTFLNNVTDINDDVIKFNRKLFCNQDTKIDAIEKFKGPPPDWTEKYEVFVGFKKWEVSQLNEIANTPHVVEKFSEKLKSLHAILQVKEEQRPQCSKLQWANFSFWTDIANRNRMSISYFTNIMENQRKTKEYTNLQFLPVEAATSLDKGVYMVTYDRFVQFFRCDKFPSEIDRDTFKDFEVYYISSVFKQDLQTIDSMFYDIVAATSVVHIFFNQRHFICKVTYRNMPTFRCYKDVDVPKLFGIDCSQNEETTTNAETEPSIQTTATSEEFETSVSMDIETKTQTIDIETETGPSENDIITTTNDISVETLATTSKFISTTNMVKTTTKTTTELPTIRSKRGNKTLIVILAAVVAGFVLLLVVGLCILLYIKLADQKEQDQEVRLAKKRMPKSDVFKSEVVSEMSEMSHTSLSSAVERVGTYQFGSQTSNVQSNKESSYQSEMDVTGLNLAKKHTLSKDHPDLAKKSSKVQSTIKPITEPSTKNNEKKKKKQSFKNEQESKQKEVE